ncbi:hypothetical protein F925_01763 [Acinetobacter lwoffii NCTC 5866 = CIP 64.10 = NIPH 512]|nr:hypothetical protein F925_01763 [Acinetobacter lwoffii NCTC 5866 = CIP 64.10 = NIPH 512]
MVKGESKSWIINYIKNWFFPEEKYITKLSSIIEKTIYEHEENYPYTRKEFEIPFYHSQIVFDELNKYVIFEKIITVDDLRSSFEKNKNIIIPSEEELINFYHSFLKKINEDNDLKKLRFKEGYQEKIFDLSKEIYDIRLILESIDSKINFRVDREWINKNSKKAILDLDKRYSPELNVDLEISKIFNGLRRNKKFKEEMTTFFDEFLMAGKKLKPIKTLEIHYNDLNKYLNLILVEYNSFNFELINKEILLDNCVCYIKKCEENVGAIKSKVDQLPIEDKSHNYNKYHSEISSLILFSNLCKNFLNYLSSTAVKVINNPYLIIEGEAGSGKSHLLGDVVNRGFSENEYSIFILGQQLITEESPWVQIFKYLQINSTADNFLNKINFLGENDNKRVVFYIDAINEGAGNRFWSNYLNSFVSKIREYEYLGLVLSVRSSYKKNIFKNHLIEKNKFEIFTHSGFDKVQEEALNKFFLFYNIEYPNFPLLGIEFSNPLFLKLFCEGLYNKHRTIITNEFMSISKIFDFFIDGINEKLSQEVKYNYNPSINLVKKVIHELVKEQVKERERYLKYERAYELIQDKINLYTNKKGFLDDLISEGLFVKNIFNEEGVAEDYIYIAYERLGDYLTVKYLLDSVKNIQIEFDEGGSLYEYFDIVNDKYIEQGIIESLSIQIPEKFGYELYECLSARYDDYHIAEGFSKSLIWRNKETIEASKLAPYINDVVLKYEGTTKIFFQSILSITSNEDHPFNALFIHNWLNSYELPVRDSIWLPLILTSSGDSVERLINWASKPFDKKYISDKSINLSAITLSWFLASNNRYIRDTATKALISLLYNKIDTLIKTMDLFKSTDDPYILERLYCVAYGCCLRTKQKNNLIDLSNFVYENIFDNDEVNSHILLRDYASGIISYSHHLGLKLEFNLQKTLPPFNSKWPVNIPSLEDLKLKFENENYSSIWYSVMGFGDFARYIIGTNSNYSDWSGCRIGEEVKDLEEEYKTFINGLSIEKKALFDDLDPLIYDESSKLKFDGNSINKSDMEEIDDLIDFSIRICTDRKSIEEVEANKLLFKEALTSQELDFFESVIEPNLNENNKFIDSSKHFDLRIAQRLIFNRVIDLGWCPELHRDIDSGWNRGRSRQDNIHERIGKKYQWIAFHEYMGRLVDNFKRLDRHQDNCEEKYQGAWDPFLRDIDPSILSNTIKSHDNSSQVVWWNNNQVFDWNTSYEEWLNNQHVISNDSDFIEVKDFNDTEWLILESHTNFSEPKPLGSLPWEKPAKEVWYQLRSYLVKDNEYEKLKEWLSNQNFMGRWMPESVDRYQIFFKEYYWSAAFSFFQNEFHSGQTWRDVSDGEYNEKIADICVTAINYLWEYGNDASIRETVSILKPCELIANGMHLQNSENDGELTDENGNLISFAAKGVDGKGSYLLIKKESFIKFLNQNNLKIIWTILGEKGVVGGYESPTHNLNRIEFSGSYFMANNNVQGNTSIKN